MLRITNGKIITPEQILEGFDLIIEGKFIKDIVETDLSSSENSIDAMGGYIAPGLIDIHSDYIETIVAPRPTSIMDPLFATRIAEKTLIGCGITTMYHSLSLFDENKFDAKEIRSRKNVEKIVKAIVEVDHSEHLIRHRLHLRLELDNIPIIEDLENYIKLKQVDLISFMDHSPGQGQYRNIEIYKDVLKGYNGSLNDSELDSEIERLQNTEKIEFEKIKSIAKLATENGIPVASHDDDSESKIDLVKQFGTVISEFPITLEVCKYAHESNLFTMVGSPNILRGQSHSGNLCATTAVNQGVVDIICSDYYPQSLLKSVFKLSRNHDLVEMYKLVSTNPAKALGIDTKVGSIKKGLLADVIIINELSSEPVVTNVIVNGEHVLEFNYRSGGSREKDF